MPIPSQNDILVPFLETLRDGQPHTRAAIIDALADRFHLTDDDLQAKRGNQRIIMSRVGWCDAYFVKAGFVTKDQHSRDNMQDEFRITIAGQNQLHRHADRIDVGYLQSFYQGNVYRGAGSSDTTSDAELDLFERFDDLPQPFVVFHSVSWIGETKRNPNKQSKSVGEIDFLVAHPDYGVLVVEVKGGEVFIEREGNRAQWKSRGYHGNVHDISDPCEQAERNRRALHEHLNKNHVTRKYDWALFPAIALPESQVDDDIRMDCRAAMVIDHRHLDDLADRLTAIFDYWQQHADSENRHFSGQPAIGALLQDLVPTRQLSPRIGDMFARERREIERLTEEQFQLLRFIGRQNRAAIVGGAGTGKTMLAIEKAQQLADNDQRVLFLAFNNNIVDWIGQTLPDNVTVTTYHSLVGTLQNRSGFNHNRGMDWAEFREQAPELLLEAAEWFRHQQPEYLWDAVIVDEAQDFSDDMWIPITDLLRDPDDGILYVFFDDNQRIYTQISNVPIDETYELTQNCRNTQRIHTTLMPYAVMDTETTCNGPEGRDPEIIPVDDESDAKAKLQSLLHRLVNEENIPHDEIVLLTPRSDRTSMWQDDEILGNFILSWDMQTEMNMAIKVCSIYSFKGLESSVVILSELDKLHDDKARQLLYVGLSRARNHAVVLGKLPTPKEL